MKIDIGEIDWALLEQQKQTLIDIPVYDEAIDGILNIIDHIQDEAAKQLGNAAVFGPEENES